MSRTVRNELRLGFGVLLGLVVLIGAGGLAATAVTATYVDQATAQVTPAIEANDALLQSLTDIETGLRGYVLSAREVALQPYRQGLRRLPDERRRLARVLEGDPAGRRHLARQSRAIDAWLTEYAVPRVDDPVGPGSFDVQRFTRAKELFDDVRSRNAALRTHLHGRLDRLAGGAERMRALMAGGVVLMTLTGLVVGALTTRGTSRRIRRPLAAVRDVLTDLIAGDHQTRAVPHGPTEVVTIARAVNALADETDRLREIEAAERRLQERLLEYSREVRSTLDPDLMVQRGLDELGVALRLKRAYVRLVEDNTLQDIGHQWCAPGVAPLSTLASPGSISALQAIHKRRQPLTSADVRADAFYDTERGRRWAHNTGARGSLTLPIAVDENPVGVITCIDFEPRDWTDREVHLAESVAADLGRALEHAKLYTAQVEAVRRLEELDRAKDEFLSSVSHELRTPLTSINGYVELLEDEDPGPVTGQQRRLLDVVRRNVDRLRLLIEDLLTLSRIESGAFRSTLQEVDLPALVRASVDDMRPQAVKGDVEVHLDLPAGEVSIQGDAGQLSRAMLNVLGNAIKFTPAGGRVDVRVRTLPATSGGGPRVVVEVRDTGMGIPAQDLGEVSTRFFRAGNAVSSGVPGTGLGLVIVRTILDNHGGSLRLTSREGEGTAVRMTLPYSPGRDVQEAAGIAPRRGSL